MSDKDESEPGATLAGSDAFSAYPVSRLAPAFSLVDIAKEIAVADEVVGATTEASLVEIAVQIRKLQERAKQVLSSAKKNMELHHAECHFQKQIGKVYHHYERPNGNRYIGMLSPEDWGGSPPHDYLGSFRLEADRSFTPLEEVAKRDRKRDELLGSVGLKELASPSDP